MSSIYHEVLVDLLGYESAFLEKLIIAQDHQIALTFVHPCEIETLKRISEIGASHRQIRDFKSCYNVLHKDETLVLEGKKLQPGLYLDAFCTGLSDALTPYRQAIIKLEAEFLSDPQLGLTYILSRLMPFVPVLDTLNATINEVKLKELHGCQILQLLYRNMSLAVISSKDAVQKLIHHCHTVFFKQLSNWLLYGQLSDRYKEFFIEPIPSTSDSDTTIREYRLCPDLLPSRIPLSVANKVLFVGQTLVLISNGHKESDPESESRKFLLQPSLTADLLHGHRTKFFEQISKLQSKAYLDVCLFEATIELIRSCVTEHLWVLAVEQAKLPDQLRLVKEMFLLGRGELFQEFIHLSRGLLDQPPSSTYKKDINQAFCSAAHKILVGSEEAKVDKFYFDSVANTDPEAVNGWTSLVLRYRVSWPLHLIFTEAVLESYNQLFVFLLLVKKTQLQLHQLWQAQTVDKLTRFQDSRMWKIRSWLVFIVDHLQYYLLVDVLESQWTILEAALSSTRDFEAVRRAHLNFLASTLSQTFLLLGSDKCEPTTTLYQKSESLKNNPVHKCLSKLLRLCERFCQFVATSDEKEVDELTELGRELEYQVRFLLELFTKLRSQPCGTHLSKLLLRLDFNRWFSKMCTGHSLTGSLTSSTI